MLNIKNEEAFRLATELASMTGESKTRVVLEALRERMRQLQRSRDSKALADELMRIGAECASHVRGHPRSTDHADLYGDDGLPR